MIEAVLDRLIAAHTTDADRVVAARKEFEERRGRVFQEEELWERWSAAFVEWFVIERVGDDPGEPPGARGARAPRSEGRAPMAFPPAVVSLHAARARGDDAEARAIRACLTSHRSLYELRAFGAGRVELLDLLGGALISVAEPQSMDGVSVGDVAELRVIGFDGDVVFGRTFVFHPRGAREAILAHARRIVTSGQDRRAAIDHIAALRVKVERYRHMSPAKVYELPTGLQA